MLSGNNPMMQRAQMIKNALSGKNPDDVYNQLYNTNPQFQKFVNDTKGKTIEDIAMEYDIDLDILKQFM